MMKKLNKTKVKNNQPNTYKFWRSFNKLDGYELMFSYAPLIGDIIIQGLDKTQNWMVKDERGRIIFSTGGRVC